MMDAASSQRVDELCNAVGRVTLAWAAIDSQFDVLNLGLKNDFGGHPNWRELPRTRLSSKLKCARACFSYIEAVSAFKQRALEIIDDIDLLSEERHWIIHGLANNITLPTIMLTRIHLERAKYEEREIETKDILLLADVSAGLANRLADLTSELNALRLSRQAQRTPD